MVQFHLAAVRQLADDLVERVRRRRGRPAWATSAGHRFDDLQVHIRGGQRQRTVLSLSRTLDRMGMVFRRSTTL